MSVEIKHVIEAAQRIIDSVASDNSRQGGLLSRDTVRACDEARLVIDRFQNGEPVADWSQYATDMDYDRGGTTQQKTD